MATHTRAAFNAETFQVALNSKGRHALSALRQLEDDGQLGSEQCESLRARAKSAQVRIRAGKMIGKRSVDFWYRIGYAVAILLCIPLFFGIRAVKRRIDLYAWMNPTGPVSFEWGKTSGWSRTYWHDRKTGEDKFQEDCIDTHYSPTGIGFDVSPRNSGTSLPIIHVDTQGPLVTVERGKHLTATWKSNDGRNGTMEYYVAGHGIECLLRTSNGRRGEKARDCFYFWINPKGIEKIP